MKRIHPAQIGTEMELSLREMIEVVSDELYAYAEWAVTAFNENLHWLLAAYLLYTIIVALNEARQNPADFWLYDLYTDPRTDEILKALAAGLGAVGTVIVAHIIGTSMQYAEWLLRPSTPAVSGPVEIIARSYTHAITPYYEALTDPTGVRIFFGVTVGLATAISLLSLYFQIRGRLDTEESESEGERSTSIEPEW